jgi:hypothetical protein
MHKDQINYFKRRAEEELDAARRAACAASADVHRALAERYSAIASGAFPHGQYSPVQSRERLSIIA